MCIFSAQFLHFLNTVRALYERLNERHEEKSFPLISRLQKILLLTLEEKKKQPSSQLSIQFSLNPYFHYILAL